MPERDPPCSLCVNVLTESASCLEQPFVQLRFLFFKKRFFSRRTVFLKIISSTDDSWCLACLAPKCPGMAPFKKLRTKYTKTTYHWQPGFRSLKPQTCWWQAWDAPPTGQSLRRTERWREKTGREAKNGWKIEQEVKRFINPSPSKISIPPNPCAHTPAAILSPVFGRMVALWMVTSSKVTGVFSMTTPRLLTKVRQASTR